MAMQSIIYGYKSSDSYFDEDAARIPYLESTLKLHGRMRPSAGRMSSTTPYDTSKGALPRDVIECPALLGHLSKERLGHRDQKPLALIEKIMRSSSRPGDTVLDAFAGSGTTIEAAIRTGRNYIGIEKNPEYFAMISDREQRAKKLLEESSLQQDQQSLQ
jgi:site-specific DNA-methyltransferase (adenine-specific)